VAQRESFEKIKDYLTKPPVLRAPKIGEIQVIYSGAVEGNMVCAYPRRSGQRVCGGVYEQKIVGRGNQVQTC
jgi:hypothetical protein